MRSAGVLALTAVAAAALLVLAAGQVHAVSEPPTCDSEPVPTLQYLKSQDMIITTVCNPELFPAEDPRHHDCSAPHYVLSGTDYWKLGSKAENEDKEACMPYFD